MYGRKKKPGRTKYVKSGMARSMDEDLNMNNQNSVSYLNF